MNRLVAFFEGSETKLGVFYPIGYFVAAFPSIETAEKSRRELTHSGVASQACIALTGDEVLEFAVEHVQKDGLRGAVMREVSRLIDTEAKYTDQDLELAKQGAAFLVVKCPTEGEMRSIWERVQPFEPLIARYFMSSGIQHLVDRTQLRLSQEPAFAPSDPSRS